MDILSCEIDPNQLIIEEESKKNINGDEYPIIWYEPDIDSEEKKTLKALIQENIEIHLFSKFEEAFSVVQSLGSFLLITPTQVNEKKLFQDFKDLQDTHGRRYFDFEEEAVLRSLFKEISEEIIKSLKVYVFCTRESFLNEASANEKEEEVMVMCDIQGMAEQFREEYTIFWCDPDFSPEMKETLVNKLDIEEKNISTDFDDLLKKLYEYNGLPYHLILSGKKTKIETIVDKIDDFKDLLCAYIYEIPPLILDGKKARKTKMGKSLEELIPRIIEGIRTNLKYKNTFPAFATQFDDWDKSHINKVHYYLRGFINFKNRRQAKGDFINLAKRIYQSKKLLEFEREYDEYKKEQILKWYAAQSPIYKLVNNCLRIATSDSIAYCRFILKDLERAIREEYQQQNQPFHGIVYRSAYITKDEFGKLERNIGKEIEMHGFLSTSRDFKIAEKFLNDDMANKVLIKIFIPPLPLPKLDEQGFADMSRFSKFFHEKEILFNVSSRFQVLDAGSVDLGFTSKDKCRHLVLLYGPQLLRKYMTIQNPATVLKFELPSEFKCSKCSKYPPTKNLYAYMDRKEIGKTQMICRKCFVPENFVSNNTFFLPMDSQDGLHEGKIIEIEVKGKLLEFDLQTKLTYDQSCKCHNCFKSTIFNCKWINLKDENVRVECLECFKRNKTSKKSKLNTVLLFEGKNQIFWGHKQEQWEEMDMDWRAKEFEGFKASGGAYVFYKAHDENKCQEFCRRVLQNFGRKKGREKSKIFSYEYLGESCRRLGDYQKALEYSLKALDNTKFIFGETHPETANLYNNLTLVYHGLEDHEKALQYHLKALTIRKLTYGEYHSHTATSYNNLASAYSSLGDFEKALEYNLKALNIIISISGESHPYAATSYHNLAFVYLILGNFEKALEFNLKALGIRKSIYGESNPNTADSYNNLASVYSSLGDYENELESYLKAQNILKTIYGDLNPNIVNPSSVDYSLESSKTKVESLIEARKSRKLISGEINLMPDERQRDQNRRRPLLRYKALRKLFQEIGQVPFSFSAQNFDSMEGFQITHSSTETSPIVNPLNNIEVPEVLGKRSLFIDDNEEKFELDIEKKFKQ